MATWGKPKSMLQRASGLLIPVFHATDRYSTWVTAGWLKESWRIIDKYGINKIKVLCS